MALSCERSGLVESAGRERTLPRQKRACGNGPSLTSKNSGLVDCCPSESDWGVCSSIRKMSGLRMMLSRHIDSEFDPGIAIEETARLKAGMWGLFGVLACLSLFTPNPWLTAAAMLTPPFLFWLLWRPVSRQYLRSLRRFSGFKPRVRFWRWTLNGDTFQTNPMENSKSKPRGCRCYPWLS